MTGYAVHTEGLSLSYGDDPALTGVDLDLAPGRIHGLLGRNGAGKTTLMSVLAALRRGTGTVRVDGQDPFENEAVMEDVCLIRESGDTLTDERLRTNLDFLEDARPFFDRAYAESLIAAFALDLAKKPQHLSRGQASAFGAIVGLASRAPLTMFDEVHLGMDAPSRQRFYDELLRDFAEHPRTIILSSHLISEVEHMLETVTILHEGHLLLSGEADDLHSQGATLTGPSEVVDRHASDLAVVGTRDLGPTRQVTVFGDLDESALRRAEHDGLQVGAVPLQDLFIHLTDTQTHQEAS
ncbi:ATP-binding cassette domain-containing protein [Ornithinimicrobium cryptoxanthini]|uniref:ABC transporter ATP-binding protein n=1 Tax=Ornithinimicrobium cryptoxanthini TaxID=2934161 RepID=A0ABY4YEE4_9MICO|nr:ABC transporter ATP-binding protein [Ornithinimicrobium cryptoxanthini]USQ75113.1 ABC transporter ATP-binding protein [Ornithinimicrobium cryptoxanthini]